MKSKLKVCLFVVGTLILASFMPVLAGCGQPASSSSVQANPQPAPVLPTPPPSEPEPTPQAPEPAPPVVVEPEPVPAEPTPTPDIEAPAEAARVDVVFFHRTKQCHSCEYAEVQTEKALEKHFAEEMASGLVTYQSINMDEESSAAITEKYAAYSSQLFITAVKGDDETTEEILAFWDFIDNDEGFSNLIIEKVNEALEGVNP